MANKTMSRREMRRAARARRSLYTRIIIIGGLLLVGSAILWLFLSTRQEKPSGQLLPTGGGATPALVGTKQYSAPPPMLIDLTRKYFATVKMERGGQFVIQLYPDKAPITANNFIFLARQGFFNGVSFHRVLDGFMAQGGDPTGTGMGDPGYSFVNEVSDLSFDKAGVVAMANSGPDTNGSQFFITFGAVGLSASDYTIFGQVVEGMDVVNDLTRRNPDLNPDFYGDVIESVTITEQ